MTNGPINLIRCRSVPNLHSQPREVNNTKAVPSFSGLIISSEIGLPQKNKASIAQSEYHSLPDVAQMSLFSKVRSYFSMLRNDSQYRTGFLAILTNQFGDGLVTGSVLVLLSSLAVLNPHLAIIGLGVFTIIEIGIASGSFLQASHLRDNTEACRRANTSDPQNNITNHGSRLCKSGYIDALSASCLVAGVIGVSFFGFGALPIFMCIVVIKAIQAFNKSYEAGAWSCIKYTLGSQQTQDNQLQMRATIGALEMGIGGLTYGVVSLGALLMIGGIASSAPISLPVIAISTAVIGGAMTCFPKVAFGRWAQNKAAWNELSNESEETDSIAREPFRNEEQVKPKNIHHDSDELNTDLFKLLPQKRDFEEDSFFSAASTFSVSSEEKISQSSGKLSDDSSKHSFLQNCYSYFFFLPEWLIRKRKRILWPF